MFYFVHNLDNPVHLQDIISNLMQFSTGFVTGPIMEFKHGGQQCVAPINYKPSKGNPWIISVIP